MLQAAGEPLGPVTVSSYREFRPAVVPPSLLHDLMSYAAILAESGCDGSGSALAACLCALTSGSARTARFALFQQSRARLGATAIFGCFSRLTSGG